VKVIGLTGRIGCGKSTVAGMLAARGVATIDADVVAREARETDPAVRAAIQARFGTEDPAAIAAVAFRDPAALADLEAIVHPAVRERVRDRLEALAAGDTDVAVIEAIKLLEGPLRDRCDEVWVVICRPEDAVARLEGRGLDAARARERMANQMPEEDMVQAADVVLPGSADLAETERAVAAALDRLRAG
jgi:dephospho-CoA kinase